MLVKIAVNKFGCRGINPSLVYTPKSLKKGFHNEKNQNKKILGILEPSNGSPIRTRGIPRGLNYRCSCNSGKKSRNCCRV